MGWVTSCGRVKKACRKEYVVLREVARTSKSVCTKERGRKNLHQVCSTGFWSHNKGIYVFILQTNKHVFRQSQAHLVLNPGVGHVVVSCSKPHRRRAIFRRITEKMCSVSRVLWIFNVFHVQPMPGFKGTKIARNHAEPLSTKSPSPAATRVPSEFSASFPYMLSWFVIIWSLP